MLARLRTAYVHARRASLYRRILRPPTPLVILRYHAVGQADAVGRYVHPSLAVSAARFREHVRILARRFHIVTPDEIPHLAARTPSGRLAVLITFDDGYIDNYEVATPILVDEGAHAAFYIATRPLEPGGWLWTSELRQVLPHLPAQELPLPHGSRLTIPADARGRSEAGRRLTVLMSAMADAQRDDVLDELWRRAGRPRGDGLEGSFVTPAQVRAMRAAGMTIGAHTRTHPQLDLLAADLREPELTASRRDLERILGEPVAHLAYPNPGGSGTIAADVRGAAARSGFRTAVTSVTGRIGPDTDLLRLPRLGIYAGAQEQQLFATLERRN